LATVSSNFSRPNLSIIASTLVSASPNWGGLHFDFFLALFVDQRSVGAPLDTLGHFQRRNVLAHVALQRQAGIGFLEQIPRRTRGATEVTIAVLPAVEDVLVLAGAFGRRVFPRIDRKEDVPDRIAHDLDARAPRVNAAVAGSGVKGRTGQFARPAANAVVGNDGDVLLELLDLGHGHTSFKNVGNARIQEFAASSSRHL
jgi:hypothetical protein